MKIHFHIKHTVFCIELLECNALQDQNLRKGYNRLFVRTVQA